MWRAINESMSGSCSSALWDTNLTWNSEDPEFTECFERTILVWLPCAFLWLSLPLTIHSFRRTKASAIPLNGYNLCKLVTIAILAISTSFDIANYIFSDQVLVYVYTHVAKFVTICLFFGLTYTSIKSGVVSSGNLFLFSLLIVLCGAPQFRTTLRSKGSVFNFRPADWNEADSSEIIEFLSYFIYYLASWVTLLLNCFADTRSSTLDDAYVCPENDSSVLSRAFFFWFDSFTWTGYRHTLEYDDVWDVDDQLKTAHISSQFEAKLNFALRRLKRNVKVRYENGNTPLNLDQKSSESVSNATSHYEQVSIFGPLVATFGGNFMLAFFVKLFQGLLGFISPLLLRLTLDYVDDAKEVSWHGYMYAILFLILAILQSISINLSGNMMSRNGIAIRTALMSAIYKKSLRISSGARRKFTTGEMVNLMSVDAERFLGLFYFVSILICAPFEICLALYFLWQILGPSVLAGVIILVTSILMNYCIGWRIQGKQIKQMKRKDERVKLTTEIFSGIKVLKLNAWEESFEKEVANIRRKEIAVLKEISYIESTSSLLWTAAPFLVSLLTFAVYVLSSEEKVLTAKTAFVSLSLLNILRFPLWILPSVITNTTQAGVSIKRINKFLNSEDLDANAVQHEKRWEPVVIDNGHFSWESYNGSPVLSNINLKVKPGSIVAVVGSVGAGKSSLLSAILGEMYKQSGVVNTTGSLAYVPQQAWIRNATVKDNITLGETPNDSIYADVLAACALNADLKMLPGRDLAEIGENGVNLSGGQKQRISLARAVYSDADTYLLDDPLSAVDSHVGKHIFEQVIGPSGLLKNKTRVLVTHNLTYLSQVDFVVVLQNGVISESGTYQELLELKGDLANYLAAFLSETASKADDKEENLEMLVAKRSEIAVPDEEKAVNIAGQKLIEDEKAMIGTVNWSVYAYYLKAIGPVSVGLILLMNVLYQIFSVASNYWLSIWTSDTIQGVNKQYIYLGVYAFFGLSEALSLVIQSIVLSVGTLKAAKYIHNRLLVSVLHWPTLTFDQIPMGRIINRFGPDLDTLDSVLPNALSQILVHTAMIISSLFVISYSIPMFVYIILPIAASYYLVQRFYIETSRQLRRFQSISKSPIYSHMGETVSGAQSIRAYSIQSKFVKMLENKIDNNQRSIYACLVGDRWLAVRLEMIAAATTSFSVIFAVLARNSLHAGIVGLAVSYAMHISQKLYRWLKTISDVETNVVAIERIKEYEDEEQEAPWQVAGENIPADWPSKGEVLFDDFQTRYRDDLEPVLKGISFNVASGEKVGVVGRTGAGKSSLTLSLFRIMEPTGGRILIDGIDITKIGLHTLRGRLTIIPQDPTLFSGTLRMNLDPACAHSDNKLWKALELANLKTFVSNLKFGLQSEVTEGGNNFSVGQRQLICLARAVLRKAKLLILDEATAAVDMETDDFIQSTIRKEFKDCTVLTIAHRLKTVLDYDRILVLDHGRIVEFDSPETLLESKQSNFYGMASDAGLI